MWSYRDTTYATTAPRGARLTAPAAGSVLPGASVPFSWTPGSGVTQYWLFVGNAFGGADIWNQNAGTALTTTVTGLPLDGRRVYARLWSLTSLGWSYADYRFTAAGTGRGRLATPAENSVLPGTSATFNWNAGISSTRSWVYVGTTLGGTDLLSQNAGSALTTTVTGLPTESTPHLSAAVVADVRSVGLQRLRVQGV